MSIFLAQEFHEIAPPVNYSLIPPWMIFVGTLVALSIVAVTDNYHQLRTERGSDRIVRHTLASKKDSDSVDARANFGDARSHAE